MAAEELTAPDGKDGQTSQMPSLEFVDEVKKLLGGEYVDWFIEEKDGRFFVAEFLTDSLAKIYLRACRAETKLKVIHTLEAKEALFKVDAIVEFIEGLPEGYSSKQELVEALRLLVDLL